MKKQLTTACLIATTAMAIDTDDNEIKQSFMGVVHYQHRYQKCCTPPPAPTPPSTPTSWDELQTTLLTAPYYTSTPYGMCMGTQSIPALVNQLQSIENAGVTKTKILERQLAFITSTWMTWEVWRVQLGNNHYPIRYNLIYKFLLNRSTQTTQKGWLEWLGCGGV